MNMIDQSWTSNESGHTSNISLEEMIRLKNMLPKLPFFEIWVSEFFPEGKAFKMPGKFNGMDNSIAGSDEIWLMNVVDYLVNQNKFIPKRPDVFQPGEIPVFMQGGTPVYDNKALEASFTRRDASDENETPENGG